MSIIIVPFLLAFCNWEVRETVISLRNVYWNKYGKNLRGFMEG